MFSKFKRRAVAAVKTSRCFKKCGSGVSGYNSTAPILVGGNRAYNNSPIHLGSFAIYEAMLARWQIELSR